MLRVCKHQQVFFSFRNRKFSSCLVKELAMTVVIEREVWEPSPLAYVFISLACFVSIILLPHFSRQGGATVAAAVPLDLGGGVHTTQFLQFQRRFLTIYSIASVIKGLESVLGEYQYTQYGLSREQIVLSLSAGSVAALLAGTFLGFICDILGPRKSCLLFSTLHLFVAALKSASKQPSVWVISVCLELASSVFSYSFETWVVIEHERQGYKQDLLDETFWLMTFLGAASLIGSQAIANTSFKDLGKGLLPPSAIAAFFAIVCFLCIRRESNSSRDKCTVGNYARSFIGLLRNDKRVYLLAFAQAGIDFSVSSCWILWAPTIVADGREVNLSLIYPCFLGARMIGSTIFPWSVSMSSLFRNEDCLISAYVVAAISILVIAYDYQEIRVLVILFCIFHICAGFITPSLARLRTVYIPNELRGGIISFFMAPGNAVLLWVLIQGGYYRSIGNSSIMTLSALGLFVSAGCILLLRRWKKHPRQEWHML